MYNFYNIDNTAYRLYIIFYDNANSLIILSLWFVFSCVLFWFFPGIENIIILYYNNKILLLSAVLRFNDVGSSERMAYINKLIKSPNIEKSYLKNILFREARRLKS